jgi:aldehyde:ferredoxin oxidoreductase
LINLFTAFGVIVGMDIYCREFSPLYMGFGYLIYRFGLVVFEQQFIGILPIKTVSKNYNNKVKKKYFTHNVNVFMDCLQVCKYNNKINIYSLFLALI